MVAAACEGILPGYLQAESMVPLLWSPKQERWIDNVLRSFSLTSSHIFSLCGRGAMPRGIEREETRERALSQA
jgi:hypothetical protein